MALIRSTLFSLDHPSLLLVTLEILVFEEEKFFAPSVSACDPPTWRQCKLSHPFLLRRKSKREKKRRRV
jgi:hypothetical protein